MFRLPCRKAPLVALAICAVALAACGGRPLLPGEDSPDTPRSDVKQDYTDAFVPGQSGNWLFEQDESGSTAIVNEQLVVTITTPNTMQYSALENAVFGDFLLEVDVWQRSGPPESSFGVLFRMQDGQQFYRFDVTGSGLFMVERRNADGTWTRLIPEWSPTTALNQGLNVANRLKVIAAGPTLTFYVNDVLLTQVNDSTFNSGGIALDAGTFGGGNLQVSFDNLSITSVVP